MWGSPIPPFPSVHLSGADTPSTCSGTWVTHEPGAKALSCVSFPLTAKRPYRILILLVTPISSGACSDVPQYRESL